jgi:hypothetical protein
VIGGAGIPLARQGNWPYLNPMVQPVSVTQQMVVPARSEARGQGRVAAAIAWGAAGLGVLGLFGAAGLWFHYGTAVFFEMIAAGVSACF